MSDPAKPFRVATYGPPLLDVVGNRLYIPPRLQAISVVDVSDRTNPDVLGGFNTTDAALGMRGVGDYAYVADRTAGLKIYDVSDPVYPLRIGSLRTSGLAQAVQVSGQMAYVATGSAGLIIVDVSQPAQAVQIGSYGTTGTVVAVDISGDYVYVADAENKGSRIAAKPALLVFSRAFSVVSTSQTWSPDAVAIPVHCP